MYRKGIGLEWWCWTRESVSDIVLDTRNKIRNDTELGDMDSPCTRKTVKNETMSEVVSGEGGKKEREGKLPQTSEYLYIVQHSIETGTEYGQNKENRCWTRDEVPDRNDFKECDTWKQIISKQWGT